MYIFLKKQNNVLANLTKDSRIKLFTGIYYIIGRNRLAETKIHADQTIETRNEA